MEALISRFVALVFSKNWGEQIWNYIGSAAGILAVIGLFRSSSGLEILGRSGSLLGIGSGFEQSVKNVDTWIAERSDWISLPLSLIIIGAAAYSAFAEQRGQYIAVPSGRAAGTLLTAWFFWQSTTSGTWPLIIGLIIGLVLAWIVFFREKTVFWFGVSMLAIEFVVGILMLPIGLAALLLVPTRRRGKSADK